MCEQTDETSCRAIAALSSNLSVATDVVAARGLANFLWLHAVVKLPACPDFEHIVFFEDANYTNGTQPFFTIAIPAAVSSSRWRMPVIASIGLIPGWALSAIISS